MTAESVKKYFFIILFFCLASNLPSQWFEQHVLTDMNIPLSIDFYDLNTGVTCGRNDFSGKVVYTSNAGTNWLSGQLPDSARACVTVQFINSQTAYISGAYNIIGTGKPMKKTNRVTHAHLMNYLSLIGNDRSAVYKGLFLKTTNGGANWFTYGVLPDSVYYLIGMHFLNLSTGYVTGDKSESSGEAVILKTTNGGLNWSHQNIPLGINTLNRILFLDFSTGFAVGYRRINDTLFQSVLLKTVNGGSLWSEESIPGTENITAIDFPNSSTGFAAAFYGSSVPYMKIYKTTNTGLNWLQSSNMYRAYIGGIDFLYGSGTGFSYGTRFNAVDSSFVSRTTNFGQTWDFQYLPFVNVFLTESCVADVSNWYLCGGGFSDSGIIIKTTNGGGTIGVKPAGSEVPDEFMLYQNYPNPFNPVTKIRFDVPSSAHPPSRLTPLSPLEGGWGVTLVIFDLLGREITTLVNEPLKPGSYEVEWDASNYPSAVYFYKIMTREFTDVKKMILLK